MKKQRNVIRIIHLIGAAAIGTFVYAPYGELEWFKLAMQIGVIPILTLTGIWLWKPKWFSVKSSSKLIIIALLAGIAALKPIETHAQEAESKVKLRGGAGSFYMGYKTFDAGTFDFFLPGEASSFDNGLLQIGGDGYYFINRFVLGGGGHYTRGDNFSFEGNQYSIHGGGAYFTLGYTVLDNPGFILFPYTNVGFEALSLNKDLNSNVEYDPDQYTSMNYSVVSPNLDVGIGADWFPLKRGFKVGAKLGYQFALNQSPKWRHTSGNTVNSPQIPELGLDGFYLRLNIGGGYIK